MPLQGVDSFDPNSQVVRVGQGPAETQSGDGTGGSRNGGCRLGSGGGLGSGRKARAICTDSLPSVHELCLVGTSDPLPSISSAGVRFGLVAFQHQEFKGVYLGALDPTRSEAAISFELVTFDGDAIPQPLDPAFVKRTDVVGVVTERACGVSIQICASPTSCSLYRNMAVSAVSLYAGAARTTVILLF
eukprot:TRINITY_DN68941_c0_g1_i1.p1 TRINITY_DN68941_c0_g1~~TRINITY_DN68941_c0_g1_i1.p1  ORF type:complete len:188 (+),score=29.82 TRINITY_DN68941_c0_g1_i1:362-925(+)